MASYRSSSSSLTVSMRIRLVGMTSRIVRVASMPLIRGMRTSMSTTSGANSSAFFTASSPSSASATTSMPSSDSSTMLSPRRNSAWSSAISTRMGSPSITPLSSATPLLWLLRSRAVDQAHVAVVAAVHDRRALGVGIGEEVEVVAEQVHLEGRLLGGHGLDGEVLGLDDRGQPGPGVVCVVCGFSVASVVLVRFHRVYRLVPPRMGTAQQLALELRQLVLELGDRLVERGEGIGRGRLGADDVPVTGEDQLAHLLLGDPRVLLLHEVDLGLVHALEQPAEPRDLLRRGRPQLLGDLDVAPANRHVHPRPPSLEVSPCRGVSRAQCNSADPFGDEAVDIARA